MRRYFKRYGELYFCSFIIISALYLMIFNYKFIRVSSRATHELLGPRYWPILILSGILILTLSAIVIKYKNIMNHEWNVEEEDTCFEEFSDVRLLKLMVSTGLYIYLLKFFGFTFLTPVFLYFVNQTVQIRGIGKKIIVAFVITAFLIFVFGRFLSVPLPRGAGIFREISFLIY